jgi:hypothetical protein
VDLRSLAAELQEKHSAYLEAATHFFDACQHLSASVLSENCVPWAGVDEAAESFTRPGMVGPSSLGPSGVHRTAPGSPLALSGSASVISTSLLAKSDSPLISPATNFPKSAFVAALPDSLFSSDCDASNDLSVLDFPIERPPSEPTAPVGLPDPSSPDLGRVCLR